MNPRRLLDNLSITMRLKDVTRHCYTAQGRHESVAEHSWLMAIMAYFLTDEFPEADMNKVIKMCILHDLGEAFTGDIPTFQKDSSDEAKEENLLYNWISSLPQPYSSEMMALFQEMTARESLESKVYKAIDGLEALIQHNASDLSTWIPLEYELNQSYAFDKVEFSAYLTNVRQEILKDTLQKLH